MAGGGVVMAAVAVLDYLYQALLAVGRFLQHGIHATHGDEAAVRAESVGTKKGLAAMFQDVATTGAGPPSIGG